MKLLKARLFARRAHKGQLDKAGVKYVKHVVRVAKTVTSKQAKLVGLLHDIVEDTDYTHQDIAKMFGIETAFQVGCFTKREDEKSEDYLERVKQSPIAIEVKLADLLDNINIFRLKKVTNTDLDRLKKYLEMYYELAQVWKLNHS